LSRPRELDRTFSALRQLEQGPDRIGRAPAMRPAGLDGKAPRGPGRLCEVTKTNKKPHRRNGNSLIAVNYSEVLGEPVARCQMKLSEAKTPRILVVEDDDNLHSLIVKVVRRSGYDAVSAYSGEQALLLLRKPGERVDWLLTDIRLSGAVDGWMVGSEFSLAHPVRPVIYMSGIEEDSHSRTAVNSIFLQKPVDVHQLLETFRRLTAQAA
jgi:CheY-like chemotaxis protein